MSFDHDDFNQRYFTLFASAYCRGRLDLDAAVSEAEAIEAGLAAGLRLHKFKRTLDLPRVRRVIGILKGLAPQSLLDVGSGKGTFLWPLLDAFPSLSVTSIDRREDRAADLHAVSRGGLSRLGAKQADLCALPFDDAQFDLVCALEVLEHIPDTQAAAAEALRVAERFVVVSVPSKADENPEHIHLFTKDSLSELLLGAGAARVNVEFVLGHMVAVARV